MDGVQVRKLLDEVSAARNQYRSKLSRECEKLQKQLGVVRPTLGATKIPVVDEPPRTPEKCHRDYLLSEIAWLREDMAVERKWKVSQWKKIGKEAMKHRYIVERESGVDLAEQHLLKTSALLAQEVEKFWKGVHQLAVHRTGKAEAEQKRVANRRRLDELVDRTERMVQDESSSSEEDISEVKRARRFGSESSMSEASSSPPQNRPPPSPQAAGPNAKQLLSDISAEMSKAQPVGHSFSTMRVSLPTPSLLRGHMREYQHIGMEWLATLEERGLNGILADEMGLGKTIQTIALLAHLACAKGVWGPHLIVVPTSVMLNWEIEFKKFLPGFKTLTYFGTPKERRAKRVGWSSENAFHVCICSYALVLQDAAVFRKKNWHYLILDEAHQIKNFKSLRWQNLLTFKTQRRLLLTGTPLQNDLLELWSLLHFLMPSIFTSHSEFQEWFAEPLSLAIERSKLDAHRELIGRLHALIKPFLLRRLKRDVEKQMPSKYEHVVPVALSRRQRSLYDEFLTHREQKQTKDYLGLMNVLMQLRKVCNHPDLLAVREVRSPLVIPPDEVEGKYIPRICFLDLQADFRKRPGCSDLAGFSVVHNEFANLGFRDEGFGDEGFADEGFRDEKSGDAKSLNARYPSDHRPLFSKFKIPTIHEQRYLGNEFIRENWMEKERPLPPSRRGPLHHPVSVGIDGIRFLRVDRKAVPRMVGWDQQLRWAAYTPAVLVRGSVGDDNRLDEFLDKLHAKMHANSHQSLVSSYWSLVHPVTVDRLCRFPDRRFLEWDSGKFRLLRPLLSKLRSENHKVILFTQMSKMLDVIEAFANLCGFSYVRLDGSTKVLDRQLIVDRFNGDKKIFLFISSTRSGGVGINLTSADTVVFFDSDWNPAMDKQAMDRCHRIGQVRDVHIYRLISESTIEENIFVKQLQKRKLDDVVIDRSREAANTEGISFDSSPVKVQDLLEGVFEAAAVVSDRLGRLDEERSSIFGTHVLWEREDPNENKKVLDHFSAVLAQVEDTEDAVKIAKVALEHDQEDAGYSALPGVVRNAVLFAQSQLGKSGHEDSEWEEIANAGWESEEDEEVS